MRNQDARDEMIRDREAAECLGVSTSPDGVRIVSSHAGGDDVDGKKPVVISPYLTAVEAAAYIRSTVQGVYALVKRGRVKPMPGSGKLLFTREALDKYLAGKRR